ncbi:MAG: hypothetical protein ACI9F9_000526 [Candidatus Paceibacteria bacterium]|jgi:hypothetical protein
MQRGDRLESALVRGGAAARYAHRLRNEIADHHASLVEEALHADGATIVEARRSADDALGEVSVIVESALAGEGARSLAVRRPFLVFLVGPLSLAVASVSLAAGLATAMAWAALDLFGFAQDSIPFLVYANASYTAVAFLILPGLAFLFCAQAWLSGVRKRWALAADLTLALLGFACVLGYHLDSPTAPNGQLYVGLGWGPRVLRFALPLLTFLAFHLLARYERAGTMLRTFSRFAL